MCTDVRDWRKHESGQAVITFVLVIALFLIATVAFGVDFTNLWFKRQAAQSAADASCQAGALDMLARSAGMPLSSMGYTPGTAGDCSTYPNATMCAYAKFNGYDGAGLQPNAASNSVAWTFPSTVSGATPPPASQAANPYLRVTVTQNVQTYFMQLLEGNGYQQVKASCTCGLVQVKAAAPMIVLNPTMAGAFTYSGGGTLNMIGGPPRSLQVNSTSTNAVSWSASGMINTSGGGPNGTGSSVGIVGGPVQPPSGGFNGGSTGTWDDAVLPIADPFAGVAVPASIKSLTPITGTSGTWVSYHQDGCPDNRTGHYPTTDQCIEFGPGYYPNGIPSTNKTPFDGYSTAIFLPGVYYMNGPVNASGGEFIRNATPCSPTCGPLTAGMTAHQTDGVMFYFLSGSFNVSGCSGCDTTPPNPPTIDPLPSTALTCDGSVPNASLGMPTSLRGNILIAQCAQNGTYWDAGNDTTDSVGSPGTRGILFYQDHANTSPTTFSGSGSLAFAGALYLHSSNYASQLNVSGGAASGTFIVGQIIADQVNLSGSGVVNLALNPVPSTYMLKVAMMQ